MLNIIVKAFFYVVNKVFSLLTAPLFLLLNTLFPDITWIFDAIFDFLTEALTYVPFILDCLFIPRAVLSIALTYVITKFTILVTVKGVKFVLKVYDALKP